MFLKRQQGNLYIVVIFVLVVMGLLATALSRIELSNSDAHTRDVLGTQAWLMSHSINEMALTLFYPLDSTSSAIAAHCDPDGNSATDGVSAQLITRANQLLDAVASCRTVALSCNVKGPLDGETFYLLESRVTCGSGLSEVVRSQQIWVKE
ncbi:MSHA biogenesis protein MshP [Vibrio sinaloensis]|uniref:MSHA biogenesis protein MshP n=1 Tax=Photobacterium sp. (strain ATCC 43367) TaxID=379097 RepID=UPI00204A9BEA|nr:MSHA biogenesis protein MshP [Vibrio sinaloensis]UPQ88302.1 MSHA biogenesis protein MshP [Vibrio sinaloensis]